MKKLREMGHRISDDALIGNERHIFGRGQIIKKHPKTGVLWGGSDPRGDGMAIGWC